MKARHAMLTFPNPSLSYDKRQKRVRFWAHDAAMGVPFFLDATALALLSASAPGDEAAMLQAFDLNRAAIQEAAARAYVRRGPGFFTLTASDFA